MSAARLLRGGWEVQGGDRARAGALRAFWFPCFVCVCVREKAASSLHTCVCVSMSTGYVLSSSSLLVHVSKSNNNINTSCCVPHHQQQFKEARMNAVCCASQFADRDLPRPVFEGHACVTGPACLSPHCFGHVLHAHRKRPFPITRAAQRACIACALRVKRHFDPHSVFDPVSLIRG